MKWSGLLSLSLNLFQMYIRLRPTAILELSIVFLVQKLPNKQHLHCSEDIAVMSTYSIQTRSLKLVSGVSGGLPLFSIWVRCNPVRFRTTYSISGSEVLTIAWLTISDLGYLLQLFLSEFTQVCILRALKN